MKKTKMVPIWMLGINDRFKYKNMRCIILETNHTSGAKVSTPNGITWFIGINEMRTKVEVHPKWKCKIVCN